ncbi:MAG: hypothetical protein AAF960_24175 [Bacteroidota bacterium]
MCLAGWVLLRIFFIDHKASIFQLSGQILLVVICFYSPVFQPWYFLLVLPFFALTTTRTWLAYCIVVFTFSNFQAIAYAVLKSHWLHVALLAFVPIMVVSFFWKFKKHFIGFCH